MGLSILYILKSITMIIHQNTNKTNKNCRKRKYIVFFFFKKKNCKKHNLISISIFKKETMKNSSVEPIRKKKIWILQQGHQYIFLIQYHQNQTRTSENIIWQIFFLIIQKFPTMELNKSPQNTKVLYFFWDIILRDYINDPPNSGWFPLRNKTFLH